MINTGLLRGGESYPSPALIVKIIIILVINIVKFANTFGHIVLCYLYDVLLNALHAFVNYVAVLRYVLERTFIFPCNQFKRISFPCGVIIVYLLMVITLHKNSL